MVLKVIKLLKSQNTILSHKANEIRTIKATKKKKKKKKTKQTHLGRMSLVVEAEQMRKLSLNGAQKRFLPLSLCLR